MLIVSIILLVGCAAWFFVAIKNAPHGWEDADGFHRGHKSARR